MRSLHLRHKKPTAVDLFAGAGLFSHAFARAGFDIIRAVDLEQTAVETYRRNLGDHVEKCDVRKARPQGRCDVLVAGPPCQGFSTLGKRDKNDPRNSLSLDVVRWTSEMRPKIVVIENVAAFIQSESWKILARRLRRLGYEVSCQILNATDFGIAQFRCRSFTFASRVGIVPPVEGRHKKELETVRMAWSGLSDVPTGENNHYAPAPSKLAMSRMRLIPPGGDKRDVMRRNPRLAAKSWWSIPGDVTDVWGRMEWNEPSNTLRTALLNPSKGRYIHPDQNRVMSLREAARLQSIPDEYRFVGLPTQIARQIGNSVPPRLGTAVARVVHTLLD